VGDLKGDLASLRIQRDEAPRRRSIWPAAIVVVALAAIGVVAALRAGRSLGAVEVETASAIVARAGLAQPGSAVLTASGYVVARRKAVVSAKIQGRLEKLNVEEGSQVREGEVIARLESADYEAQVVRARAQVQRAEADLAENQRQLRLADELARANVLARDSLEAAQSRVRIAEASVALAKADLVLYEALFQNTFIRAPFTGTVVKKMAEVGESVAPIPPGVNISTASGAIVALADLYTLEVETDVAESNVAKLGPDQPAEVSVEAFPDRKFRAVLRQVIPTADRTKATVQVKVTILDKDKDLKPEMSAKVTFLERDAKDEPQLPQERPTVVTVPKETLTTRQGKPVVFEVLDGHVRSRSIEAGSERQGQVVVKAGLAGGETLVLRPPQALKDGDAVRIKG
jgi:RND family efflux transporter MFP subunit